MKAKYIILCTLIIVCCKVFSQQSFIHHSITRGSSPRTLTLADIDGDSDLDILSVYFSDNLVAWHRNNGIGYFDSLIIVDDMNINVHGVCAEDIDNDGDLDIITGGKNNVSLYLNLGNGSFGQAQSVNDTIEYTMSVLALDLDQDTLLDICYGSSSDNLIAWQKNLGNVNFGLQETITNNVNSVYSIYANDLDLDGKQDIISASYYDNKIAWYKNLGGGNFGPQQIITNNAQGAFGVMATDLDNDNMPDIITSHAFGLNDKITWHKNLGNGNFSTENIINNTLKIPRYFFSADINNDNKSDLVMTSWYKDTLVWQENLGYGNFGPMQLISNTLDGPYGVCGGDLNGDGTIDLVAGGSESCSIEVYINHGSGLFDLNQTIAYAAADAYSVYATDLDNDGLTDIISVSRIDNKIAWYKNMGNKQFSLQKVISDTRNDTRSVYASDLDNDGLVDVISTAWGDTLAWHKNLGNGNFDVPQKIHNTTQTSKVMAKDLDNDGLDDIVFTMGGAGNSMFMVKNLGNGNWGPLQSLYSLSVEIQTMDIDDINNDGYMDIAYGNSSILAIGLNDGMGNFLPTQQINTNYGALSLCLKDFDNDGYKDIVYTVREGLIKVVKWYPNNGLGSFNNTYLLAELPEYSYTICTSDIDNDTDPDIVVATKGSNPTNGILYYIENLGAGNFGILQVIDSLGGNMRSVFPADFDNDGDDDFSIAQYGYSRVMWLENPLNNLMETITICAEDSAQVFGNWVSQPGDYTDTLTNSQGGDSINIVRVENYQTYFPTDTVSICQGETYNFHGQLLDTTGLYHATFQSIHGCDSIEELPLVLIPAPEVSISAFVPDSVSIDSGFIDMPGATPTGGYYMGTGVTTYGFNSTFAGLGEHWITYSYTDSITGCIGIDSTLIKVYDPIGIDEIETQNIKLYPNPGTGDFVLTGTALQSVRISTLDGELVKEVEIKNFQEVRFSLKGQAKGTYLVHIINDGVEIKRLLVLM